MFKDSLHWLIIGLVLIAAFFAGRALVTYYVPQAPQGNYPLSFYSEVKLPYSTSEDLSAVRAQAFQQANQKAQQVAQLTNKQLGKLTGLNETINDNPTSSMGGPDMSPMPEATPGAQTKEYILGLTYELK